MRPRSRLVAANLGRWRAPCAQGPRACPQALTGGHRAEVYVAYNRDDGGYVHVVENVDVGYS